MPTIILTGGGTAGHVFGNIALLDKLRTYFDRIIYIGSENGVERDIVSKYHDVEYLPVRSVKLIRKFTFKNFTIPFVLMKSYFQCKKIIKEKKPNVIFSKGGYVSIPVVWAGSNLKVPVISHESDLSLGLANRITKNRVKVICTTFKQTAENLKNGVYVGSPTRIKLLHGNKDFAKQFNIGNKKVLIVMGGSQGSQVINQTVWNNLDFLTKHFFVFHITGKNKKNDKVKNANYVQFEYTDKVEDFLSISDFAITRGGSNAIFEFLTLKIPMLIIPLSKKISRGDQIQNAKYFEKEGFALTLEEENLSNENFKQKIEELISKKDNIKRNMEKLPQKDSLSEIFNIIKQNTKN